LAIPPVLLALGIGLTTISANGGRPFSAALPGVAAAPGPGNPDASGQVDFTLNRGQGQVCFEITVAVITLPATGAHIHVAPEGVPGPVVVPLTPPGASGSSSGCVEDVDRT
jgi:hypothetical protein